MNIDSWDFWENLGSPKYVTAPMVDMSELPFRTLTRRYNSDLCFTPMFHSYKFGKEPKYRKTMFTTNENDRPLFVQFCSNDSAHFLKASQLVEDQCDAIDLNLGCPQKIAKRGNYGAYIMDDWELVHDMVSTASKNLTIPITCKIRIFENDLPRSIQYAQMLEKSGCKVLTVHGRHIDQKGPKTKLADWDVIKMIKQSVRIPLIANGNLLNYDDSSACLSYTGADAVMSAEGLLHNPALFADSNSTVWEMAKEFLDACKEYPIPIGHVRGHIFKLLHLCLPLEPLLRQQMILANCLEDFYKIIQQIQDVFQPLHTQYTLNQNRQSNLHDTLFTKLCSKYIPKLADNLDVPNRPYFFYNPNPGSMVDIIEPTDVQTIEQNILLQYFNIATCKSPYVNFGKIACDFQVNADEILFADDQTRATLYGLSSVPTFDLNPLSLNNSYLLPPWMCHSIPHFI